MTPGTQELAARFKGVFGAAPDALWQAPERVSRIGEHTDYNEGFVLPFAIDRQPGWPSGSGRIPRSGCCPPSAGRD